MRISEMIEILQNILDKEGDLPVKYENEEANCFYYVDNVEAYPGDEDCDFVGIH